MLLTSQAVRGSAGPGFATLLTPRQTSVHNLGRLSTMCGIVGYLDRSGSDQAPIGDILVQMLTTLSCRGPDSAGVAIYGESRESNLLLRIKLGERGDFQEEGAELTERIGGLVPVVQQDVSSDYLRLVLGPVADPEGAIGQIQGLSQDLELVSAGRQLEIIKQVGSPANLDRSYSVTSLKGSHGLGHTRLSTESRVDLSHSQPFWAQGVPDVATVHNGHITNYHKLRRQYEQRGVRFFTENDSEIIGIYLRDQLSRGRTLEGALSNSLDDFDGSFCYLVATRDSLAYVKDRFALKPLMVAESTDWIGIATEEIALRACLPGEFEVYEPGARGLALWSVPSLAAETA